MFFVPSYTDGSRGRIEGVATPLWEVFELVWLPMSVPFSYQKNIIISYCFMRQPVCRFGSGILLKYKILDMFLLAIFSSLYLYKLYIFCFSSLYSDDGLTSETSVSILSFLRCRIYIFITKLFLQKHRRSLNQFTASQFFILYSNITHTLPIPSVLGRLP